MLCLMLLLWRDCRLHGLASCPASSSMLPHASGQSSHESASSHPAICTINYKESRIRETMAHICSYKSEKERGESRKP